MNAKKVDCEVGLIYVGIFFAECPNRISHELRRPDMLLKECDFGRVAATWPAAGRRWLLEEIGWKPEMPLER